MLGHVVSPGCVSFYKKDGKTFAPPPGRWFLTSYKARWNEQDYILNHDKIDIKKVSKVISGGDERQDSVEIGLRSLSKIPSIVAVHDGVRPLVTVQTIDEVIT